jgi:hypothetical protein
MQVLLSTAKKLGFRVKKLLKEPASDDAGAKRQLDAIAKSYEQLADHIKERAKALARTISRQNPIL